MIIQLVLVGVCLSDKTILVIVYIMLLCSLYSTLDIDECVEGISGCSQVCSNTDGSFECSCTEGYSLGLNGKICEGACVD